MLFGKLNQLSTAEQERVRVETEQWERQQEAERPVKVFWAWAQRVMLALAIISIITVVWLYGVRRAVTIGADRRGIFPLLLGRVPVKDKDGNAAKAWVVYDPNRSPSAVTVIGETVRVTHAIPDGIDQARITSQAQSVQALAAISSSESTSQKTGELASGLIGATHQLAHPLPKVKRSPWESSHIERLLIEAGELEEDHEW